MANFRQSSLEEIGLKNTFEELELGNELLDERIYDATVAAAALFKDLIEMRDRSISVALED